ncbi:outer membrane protein assembly factor BamD [bacterium]|nr:MAG: outer membrane protein assembly factor BamD [bacterium]
MTSLALVPAPARSSAWRWLALAVLAVVLGLGGCRSNPQDRLSRLSPEVLYQRAQQSMRSQDWGTAIRIYEALAARYPFTDQARQARIDVMYAYYRNREKESALDAAETFLRENPTHPRADYAYYIQGLVDFERTPYRIERWLNVDLTERPPTTARKSFQAFRTVVERYPKSAYAGDARRRMTYLRNRLADYEMQVARYYEKRGAWVAAAQRAKQTIEQYDGAPAIKEAMQILIRAYNEMGYGELAANAEKVYAENFPNEKPVQAGKAWWQVWRRG